MGSPQIPVLEIGGTHVTAALVDTGAWRVVGDSVSRRTVDADGGADAILATLVDVALTLRPVAGSVWGVALPGPFDYARGVADYHGVGKFDALRGVDLGDFLSRALTGKTGSVHFLNDADAFAVGEWVAGAAMGHGRTIGVTLGTGVGSAFLIDGHAKSRGRGVPPEGRLDLLEIEGRPLEDTVSRRAISARYAALAPDAARARLDVRAIAALARAGDDHANRAIAEALRPLGRVLAPRAMDFGASMLVIGGSISQAWDVIYQLLRSGMDQASPGWFDAFAVAPAQQLEDAALLGAARHAWTRGPR